MSAQSNGLSRRRAMQLLAGTATAGLAGCGGDGGTTDTSGDGGTTDTPGDGGGGTEHGERVPTVTLGFFTGFGAHSTYFEQWADIFGENLGELGVEVEFRSNPIAAVGDWLVNDERIVPLPQWVNTPNISRLEPGILMSFWSATLGQGFGSDGFMNYGGWINCDYEEHYAAQAQASDQDVRRQEVYDALSVMSHDVVQIPQMPVINYGAWNDDEVDLQGTGSFGISQVNPFIFIRSSHRSDGRINCNVAPNMLPTGNPEAPEGGNTVLLWGTLVYSPLAAYNESGEFNPVLAENYEFENNGQRFVFTLRDDITFHDGEPITADDVEFTFNLHNDNPQWSTMSGLDVSSTEVVDDLTWAIDFNSPSVPLLSAQLWKMDVLPSHIWQDATDSPNEFQPDPIVGSGPFEVANFQRDSLLHLTPFAGHPLEGNSEVVLQTFQDLNSSVQAFRQGELNVITSLSFSAFENLQNSMGDQNIGFDGTPTLGPYYYLVQCNTNPTQFKEFRDAAGTAMDRELMNQTAFAGTNEVETHAGVFMKANPFRPPDDMLYQLTDSPSGDVDAARQKLADAGWTWDDDGRLHYPADADLSPPWPKDEFPSPEDFPCINSDGEVEL